MAEGKRAGWYPDPSGLTKKFRWWNGEQWTVAVADTLWAREPQDAAPYVAPAPGRHAAPAVPTGPTLPTVVEVDDLDHRGRRRWIVGVITAVVVLGAAATVTALWLSRGDGTEPVANSTSPAASPSAAPSPSPTASPSPSPTGSPTASPTVSPTASPTALPAPVGGRLRFAPPDATWRSAPTALRQDLPNQQAMYLNTEELWDGKRNWSATIIAGDLPRSALNDAPPGVVGNLPKTADAIARWFLRTEWNSPPSYGPADGKQLQVDGRPAYRIRTQVAYNFKGLKSKHDNIDVVVIDYGPKRAQGLVIALVPETHPQLSAAVDQAIGSLHLEGAK